MKHSLLGLVLLSMVFSISWAEASSDEHCWLKPASSVLEGDKVLESRGFEFLPSVYPEDFEDKSAELEVRYRSGKSRNYKVPSLTKLLAAGTTCKQFIEKIKRAEAKFALLVQKVILESQLEILEIQREELLHELVREQLDRSYRKRSAKINSEMKKKLVETVDAKSVTSPDSTSKSGTFDTQKQ